MNATLTARAARAAHQAAVALLLVDAIVFAATGHPGGAALWLAGALAVRTFAPAP